MQGRRFLIVAAVLLVCWSTIDRASPQQPGQPTGQPRILQILPCGGKAGTTFELIVSGQDLDHATGLMFSDPGITAEPLGSTTPPTVDPKAKLPKGAVANSQKFGVTVPRGTRLGLHDVRIVTPLGVSNPRAFVVGDLKEFVEKEPNNNTDQMQKVEMNCTVNGIIASPTDVDYFTFAGKKGQRVVISCLTTSIDSKLPATIELYSAGGAYLGFNRNYHQNDALLDCDLPADGDYYVRVGSFTYTLGGPDYFYRLTISTAPWIDAVYPPIVEPGKKATVTVYGRNLPGGKADSSAVIEGRTLEKMTTTVDVPKDAKALQRLDFAGFVPPVSSGLDGFEFRVKNAVGSSNGVLLTYAQAPVVLDGDDNDEPAKAQKLTLPCEVAGRVEKKGDKDWFAFTAKKGEVYSIDIYGDRLGSPVDMYFSLRTAGGQVLKEDDDNPEILGPQFYTQTNDPPRYRFVVPADGTYHLMVASRFAYTQAGPRHQYRLRITPERPDFRVVAMPAVSLNPDGTIVRQGGHQILNVYVWRQDGFTGPVTITAKDLPAGIVVKPQVMTPLQKQVNVMVISATAEAKNWEGPIQLVATATIQGKEVVREVRAATITWPVQAVNVPAISRLDRSLVVAVRERGPFSLTPAVEKITITQGEKIEVPLKLERFDKEFTAPVQVTATALPAPLLLQPVTLNAGKDATTLTFQGANALQPGTYTLVFRGQAIPPGKDPKVPKGPGLALPSAPVTLTVLPKAVATVKFASPVPVKKGGTFELAVSVNRLLEYSGEFKVSLLVSTDAKGLSAAEATIPAGETVGKLVIAAAPDTGPGPFTNLTVRVTADFNGVPLHHDKKLTVNVVK
jgi:hypothetical protein